MRQPNPSEGYKGPGATSRRRRPVAGLSVVTALVVSSFGVLPAAASSDAATPMLSAYPAGVGPTAGNGAGPQEIAVGPDGNLWYTDGVAGIYRFSPTSLHALACSSAAPAPGCNVSPNVVAPTGIVAGPDGGVWFTQSAGGNPGDGRSYFPASIGRLSAASAYSSYPVPSSPKKVPGLDAIALGPNGALWFTETALDRIGEITPRVTAPVIHEFALPAGNHLGLGVGSPISSADTIAAGPGHDLWFTEQGSNAIGVMSTAGALVSRYVVPNANLNPDPLGITEGPDETMWFTESAANQVARITAQGKITVFALPGDASGPASIVYGPDGNLWFTDNSGVANINPGTGKVTTYPGGSAGSGPAGITVGPNCASIWFTEPGADRLGRVAPIPDTTGCEAIAAGPPAKTSVPPLSFSPSPLALGKIVGGDPGVTMKLTVSNMTSQSLTLGRLSASVYVGQWEITDEPGSTCHPGAVAGGGFTVPGQTTTTTGLSGGTVLGPGQQCYFWLTIETRSVGPGGFMLSLGSSSPSGLQQPKVSVAVTATGVGALSFSPSPLALGRIIVGAPGTTVRLRVTNNLRKLSQGAPSGSLTLGRLSASGYVGQWKITDEPGSTCHPGAVAGGGFTVPGQTTTTTGLSGGTVLGPGQQCYFWLKIETRSLGAGGFTLSLSSTDTSGVAQAPASVSVTGSGARALVKRRWS